ncbi:MAG: amino acid--tRNA ligase-related protein [Saprospiraceae bacterium]
MHQYIRQFSDYSGQTVTLKGWVANSRDSKGLVFLVFRDGTGFTQAVISEETVGAEAFEIAKNLGQEAAIILNGTVVSDERQFGGYELQVQSFELVSQSVDYPITPKDHGVKFLSDHRHLWLRSKRQWAIMRVRNEVIMGIHDFFQSQGFVQMDAPIFTGNAVEGTTDLFATDFFGEPAFLSQSGQLYGEAMAMAQGLIYTFGPTFRAEKSDTPRHLAEFWMIEPEMAYFDNEMNMNLIESFIRSITNRILEKCKLELEVLERDITRLESVNKPFPRITYDDAVKILQGELRVNGVTAVEAQEKDLDAAKARLEAANAEIAEREEKVKTASKGERRFHEGKILSLRKDISELEEQLRNLPMWIESANKFEYGNDFGNSDETVLTRLFDAPIMVYNWPTDIKAFYMKELPGNPKLVKNVDLLAPDGYGEIIGGSERETDLDILIKKIDAHHLSQEVFEWYKDLRRFGSVPHSGFGLGLERVVRWMCGIHHLRETIPFPRRYGRLFP